MPEGDTIYRSAVQLRRAIVGNAISAAECHNPRFERPLPHERLVGQTCVAVEPRGKHLLMHLGDGAAIHSHMGMTGSWHLYRTGEPWQKPRRYASLAMIVDAFDVVCFTPKTLQWLSPNRLRRHPHLYSLGPDLLDPAFDATAAVARLRGAESLPIGEAIMNQRIVSGIGNVYKSETLFIEQLDPFAPVAKFDDETLAKLLRQAQKLMRRNLEGHRRRTRFTGDGRKWVYGRAGEPCLKCGERIKMRRLGDAGRSTYWCPHCQPPPACGLGAAQE